MCVFYGKVIIFLANFLPFMAHAISLPTAAEAAGDFQFSFLAFMLSPLEHSSSFLFSIHFRFCVVHLDRTYM